MAERIPDEALVVRGGRNEPQDLAHGVGTHPTGLVGVSVESMAGKSLDKLAAALPHSRIGVTTVGAVRAAGGDVIQTSGRSPNHATMTGLSSERASRLLRPTRLTPRSCYDDYRSTHVSHPRIYADFQNADRKGRLRLNNAGTIADVDRNGLQLSEGLVLAIYSDDEDDQGRSDELRVLGTVEYSTEEKLWVAAIDWTAIHHRSAEPLPERQPRRSATG